MGVDQDVVHNVGCGGTGPVNQGTNGVNTASDALREQGYPVLRQEVSFRTPGARVSVDLAGVDGDRLVAIEVKNGPTAVLTPNQVLAYPYFINEDVANIIPIGRNAQRLGLTPGLSLQAQGISSITFIFWRLGV